MPLDSPNHKKITAPAIKLAGALTEAGEFTGYASTFGGAPDAFGDVIAKGAFAKSLAEHRGANSRPALLFNHNPDEPVGVWLDLREDEKGLYGHGKITTETERGRELRELIKDGAMALSIGYVTRKSEMVPGPAGAQPRRKLLDIDLWEVSIVSMPANRNARITSVKSMPDGITNPRAFERFLREHGFSKSAAVAITAKGFAAAVTQGEPDAAAIKGLADALKRGTATFNKIT